MSYIQMPDELGVPRIDPELDREHLLRRVAESALRINDKLLGRQGAQQVTTHFPSDTTAIQPAPSVASSSKARR